MGRVTLSTLLGTSVNSLKSLKAMDISLPSGSVSWNDATYCVSHTVLHSMPEKTSKMPWLDVVDMRNKIWGKSSNFSISAIESHRIRNKDCDWLSRVRDKISGHERNPSFYSGSHNCSKPETTGFKDFYELSWLCEYALIQVLVIHCRCLASFSAYNCT